MIIDLITSAGFSTYVPFFSLYLHQERGIPMTLVGVVFLISGLLSSVMQVVGGILSDRFGRRSMILASMGLHILVNSVIMVLVSNDAPVMAILVVFIIGRVAGMAGRPAISAMIVDLSKPEKLTETYGLLRVGRNVGWASGPALGGYLANFMPYAWLFGVAVIFNAVAFLIVLFFLKESKGGHIERVDIRTMFAAVSNPTFIMFTFFCLLVFLATGHFGSTLSVYTVDRIGFSTTQYGLLLTTNGLFVVLFQYPVALGISKIRKAHALILGSILYGFGYLFMGWIDAFGWAILAMVIITIGEIIFSPVSTSVVGEFAPADQRGRYMGFFGWSETLGIAFAPLIGGVLLDTFLVNPGFVWVPISIFGFIAAFGFFWWSRRAESREYESRYLEKL